MLLVVGKDITGGICHAIHQHARANNKDMKDYDKNKESLCLKYWDVNNFYAWAMPQKLPLGSFKWISQFNEDFMKIYNGDNNKEYFLEIDVYYLKSIFG